MTKKRLPYDPNADPFLGRLVKILDGEGPRRKWRDGVVGFSFNKEIVRGNKIEEIPTGKYQIMWGKFSCYEDAQKVKLAKQNWSSELPENGYNLLQLEEQGLLQFTDGQQPGTPNVKEPDRDDIPQETPTYASAPQNGKGDNNGSGGGGGNPAFVPRKGKKGEASASVARQRANGQAGDAGKGKTGKAGSTLFEKEVAKQKYERAKAAYEHSKREMDNAKRVMDNAKHEIEELENLENSKK